MMSEKIRMLLVKRGMSVTDLAKRLDMSPQNLHAKLKRDNFTENDLRKIAGILDADLSIGFILGDGSFF